MPAQAGIQGNRSSPALNPRFLGGDKREEQQPLSHVSNCSTPKIMLTVSLFSESGMEMSR